MTKILTVLSFILVLVVGISFACLNTQIVSVNYYVAEASLPLSILLAITLSIGVTIGLLCSVFSVLKLKIVNKYLRNKLEKSTK